MYGICLKCDRCGATIGGEQVTANPQPPLGRWEWEKLRAAAAERGWKFRPPGYDYCPECASGLSDHSHADVGQGLRPGPS